MLKMHNYSTQQSSQILYHLKKQEKRLLKHDISHVYIRLFKHRRIKKNDKGEIEEKKRTDLYVIAHMYVYKRERDKNYTKCTNKCLFAFFSVKFRMQIHI
jgi:hypothetical protein